MERPLVLKSTQLVQFSWSITYYQWAWAISLTSVSLHSIITSLWGRWGKEGSGRLSSQSKVTEPISSRAKFQAYVYPYYSALLFWTITLYYLSDLGAWNPYSTSGHVMRHNLKQSSRTSSMHTTSAR